MSRLEPIAYIVYFSILIVLFVSNSNHISLMTKEISDNGIYVMISLSLLYLFFYIVMWNIICIEFTDTKDYKAKNIQNVFFGIEYKDDQLQENRSAPLFEFWKYVKMYNDNNGKLLFPLGTFFMYGVLSYMFYSKFSADYITDNTIKK